MILSTDSPPSTIDMASEMNLGTLMRTVNQPSNPDDAGMGPNKVRTVWSQQRNSSLIASLPSGICPMVRVCKYTSRRVLSCRWMLTTRTGLGDSLSAVEDSLLFRDTHKALD